MTVEWEGKVHEIDRRLTVARLLDMFSLSKEAHLVAANGILATEDRMLERDDRVRIVRVISGDEVQGVRRSGEHPLAPIQFRFMRP